MAKIIDSSFDRDAVEITTTWVGSLSFKAKNNGSDVSYDGLDIKSVETIDEEAYRSAGKAAVGAVVAGVLTGGIGLIAGAAFGGRRRKTGTYLVVLMDGQHVAFSVYKKATIKALNDIEIKLRVKAMGK